MEEFKQAQRAMWGAGDYATVSERIADVGELVVARAGVADGMDVLDVACGAGNAAIPAARAGAKVTGLDLVPSLLEAGRQKAEAAGVEVEWVEGDAEELPFEDGSFDRVLSTFGHMFAPRHKKVADEMTRVCRAGGTIGICTWTPEGVTGEFFKATAAFQPPPPDYASPPILWGTEDPVREMFEGAKDFEFERQVNTVEAESVDAWAEFFMNRFPPMVTAQQMLGERFEEFRSQAISIWERRNEADNGGFRLPQEYLLSVIRL